MKPTLSVCIPVYNFGAFLPETLNSILGQERAAEVEVVVVDGASTDETPDIVASIAEAHPNLRYVRLPVKGGIDRDMAKAVDCGTGDYCWLFSGDDIMRPGALAAALTEIESGLDLYLCKHMEFVAERSEWIEWPTLDLPDAEIFDLSDARTRVRYFRAAANSEAFFSFMGGLVVRRASWSRVPLNEAFVGSCWAHVARFFELMTQGLTVKYLTGARLDRRPDNDSFSGNGVIERYRLAIEGFHRLAAAFFDRDSVEARSIRRIMRHEYHLNAFLLGKVLCEIDPRRESRELLDRLFALAYRDVSWSNLRARAAYATVSASRFRDREQALCRRFEEKLVAARG